MKAAVAKKKWAYNPALQRVADALTDAFGKVGEKIRLELKRAYRRDTDLNFKALMEACKDPKNTGHIGGAGSSVGSEWYLYAHYDQDAAYKAWAATKKADNDYTDFPPNNVDRWEDLRRFEKFMSADYYRPDQHSKMAYERARDSFINKNMRKIEHVLGDRRDVGNVEVKFAFRRGAFEGDVRVALDDGFFRAEVGLKYVIRTVPYLTPYFQYPLLFVEAEIGGKRHKCQSEKELKDVLAGHTA